MPYLHWEILADHRDRMDALLNTNMRYRRRKNIWRKALDAYISRMHIRRTLDQYFYSYLRNTDDRDNDQVVTRYTRDVQREFFPSLLMVDQLWLFMLGESR